MTPRRVQVRRVKGWRMPPNTVYVGRPSRWGNPWPIRDGDRAQALRLYRATLVQRGEGYKVEVRRELRGKNLACWCPEGVDCHADILLEIANG